VASTELIIFWRALVNAGIDTINSKTQNLSRELDDFFRNSTIFGTQGLLPFAQLSNTAVRSKPKESAPHPNHFLKAY
jgi:hypothetical protein